LKKSSRWMVIGDPLASFVMSVPPFVASSAGLL